MPCECRICTRSLAIDTAVASRDTDALIRLVGEVFAELSEAEDERDYLRAIMAGSWPQGCAILERAIEKYKEHPA